jgi:Ser/Thr protein kinase RdoA (MazF antagonist)
LPKLTDSELAEIAMCLRMDAIRSREEAELATNPDLRATRIKTAELREQLAERIERARRNRTAP